jgi:hypothetical protein
MRPGKEVKHSKIQVVFPLSSIRILLRQYKGAGREPWTLGIHPEHDLSTPENPLVQAIRWYAFQNTRELSH